MWLEFRQVNRLRWTRDGAFPISFETEIRDRGLVNGVTSFTRRTTPPSASNPCSHRGTEPMFASCLARMGVTAKRCHWTARGAVLSYFAGEDSKSRAIRNFHLERR
jgi:hypothetical protein